MTSDMPNGLDYGAHAYTQAIIGIFLVIMCMIFVDICIKFAGFNRKSSPKLEVKQNSVKSVQSTSQTVEPSQSSQKSQPSTASNKKGPKPVLKFYQNTSIICILTFIIAVAIDFADGVYYFATGIDVFHTDEYWLVALTNMFYGISAISLYIFIFGRLYLTFKETEHSLSKATIIIVIALIVVNSIATLLYQICYFIRYYHLSLGLFYQLLNASNVFIIIADAVINVFILCLFAYKLQQIFVDWGEYEDTPNVSGSVVVNKAQIKLASCLTKHVILSTAAMISNTLFYGSVIAGSNVHPLWVLDLYFLGYSNLVKAFAGFVVTGSLYLNMGLRNSLYLKLCRRCHNTLQNGFIMINKKKIEEKKGDVELEVGSSTV